MARTRNISPKFFKNEELAELNPLARLLFIGLWCLADKEGRLEDRPKRIKAEVLPYDDCNVDEFLEELAQHKFIIRYRINEGRYIQIINFIKYQHPHPLEAASTIPAPENISDSIQNTENSDENTYDQNTISTKNITNNVKNITSNVNYNTSNVKNIISNVNYIANKSFPSFPSIPSFPSLKERNKKERNFNFEKDELKETETSQENVSSQSLITPAEISQNDPPTVPPAPPTEDDFTRDSNRIQTAYKRLFKYDGDTSCLVELLQKNPPRVILDIMSWASKYGMWERKSKTPQEFLANFNEIKDFKYQLELNDRMFQRGEMRAGKDGSINDPELLAAINKWVSTKKLE